MWGTPFGKQRAGSSQPIEQDTDGLSLQSDVLIRFNLLLSLLQPVSHEARN